MSGWQDSDKEGGRYRDYFCNCSSYSITNFTDGHTYDKSDIQNLSLDLCDQLDQIWENRWDVVFNHTVLEHIFNVTKAVANLSYISAETIITVVPFSQIEHGLGYGDYWRFTPQVLTALYKQYGFETIYCSSNTEAMSKSIYIFHVCTNNPEKYQNII